MKLLGLVRLISRAPGATSSITWHAFSVTGMVRRALFIPPGPNVSSPGRPNACGNDSSEAGAHGGDLRQFVLRAPVQNNINRRAVGALSQRADQFRRGNTAAAEDSE